MFKPGVERVAPQTILPSSLHAIARLRWEREGIETFDILRARLLDNITRILEWLNADPKLHFTLGGQTVILEDIASVRPDLVALLVIYNAGGRISIGPWYVQTDEALVSGESLIRNLLMARADATQHGLKLVPVGYLPDGSGHISQLPQLFQGFGIDAAFLQHGTPLGHLPFRWESPDGSAILVMNHDQFADTLPRRDDSIFAVLDAQRDQSPTSPMLWLLGNVVPPVEARDRLSELVDVPVIPSNLMGYIAALRDTMADHLRPALKGELRLQGLRPHSYLLPGMLSARLYLKQTNARLENLLTHAAEPWLALALTHGALPQPDNLRALLNYSWRLLLKNQGRSALGGNGSDAVHDENEIRARQCEDTAQQVIAGALRALPGEPHWEAPFLHKSQKTSVVVWNPHNWPLQQVVEVPLRVPADLYPAEMADPDGMGVLFAWQEANSPDAIGREERVGLLSFLASAPPVGYSVYSVYLSDALPDYVTPSYSSRPVISTVPDPITLSVENGRLVTRVTEPPEYDEDGRQIRAASEHAIISDLLRFVDGGDAGDTYNYAPPESDYLALADLSSESHMESTPIYQRLILNHRLRVATGLHPDGSRGRGVTLLELTTAVTLYDYVPGVYFQTTFRNPARDHRLRAHIRTGIQSDEVLAGTAFDVVSRQIASGTDQRYVTHPNMEAVSRTQPMLNLCAVQDASSGLALVTRGLPEFEPILEDGQVTLALTLLRAVGWISRSQVKTRSAPMGPPTPANGAQCRRTINAHYALIPIWPNDPTLLRSGYEFNAPLQAYQYRQPPDDTRHSYLTIKGDAIVMTALKPPRSGAGIVVRLLNPTEQVIEVSISAPARLRDAYRLNLAEDILSEIPLDNGHVRLAMQPHKLETLHLRFG